MFQPAIIALPRSSGVQTITATCGPPPDVSFPAAFNVIRAGAVLTVLTLTSWIGQTIKTSGAAAGYSDQNLVVGDTIAPSTIAYVPVAAGDLLDGQGRVLAPSGGGGGGDLLATLVNAPVSVTGATSAVFGKLHVCSGTSANYTVGLPNPSGNANRLVGFRMAGGLTKLVTIAPFGSETIDGAASRVLWAGEKVILYTDGTNWYKLCGTPLPMRATARINNAQSIPSATHTKVLLNQSDADNTGLMVDLTNHQIVCQRQPAPTKSPARCFSAHLRSSRFTSPPSSISTGATTRISTSAGLPEPI